MTRLSVTEIEKDLGGFLEKVLHGESILIVDSKRTLAEVKPVASRQPALRPFGLCKGEFTVPDDFDAPLPDEILRQFEGP
jgi:antitoxin (DNA-binding transcriptional repressor) of toxin-antitoxin stability system